MQVDALYTGKCSVCRYVPVSVLYILESVLYIPESVLYIHESVFV